jgi:hypothetical protein
LSGRPGGGIVLAVKAAAGLRSLGVALVLATAVSAPGAALAHDVTTAQGHEAEDTVVHTVAAEAQYDRTTLLRSAWAAASRAAAVADDPGQVGQWGPVEPWPVVGIHVALLPTGKILAWDSVGDSATESFPVHDFTRATVYDPVTGIHTPAWVDTGFNIFCAGFAHLTDGSLFIAGGNKNAQLQGIVQTHLFNPTTSDWTLGPTMAAGRWYPSVTPLTNGEMLITEGGPDTPEVRRTDGTLRTLSTATLNLPLYPWLDVAPDGRVFYSGPDQTMRKLNPAGGGSWQTFGQRDSINRSYGSHAVYDIGKTLVAGGGGSSRSAVVIDTNGASPVVTPTASMVFGRRQHNLTLLADGTVLATGGNSTGASLIDMNGGVYNAELWNPATGQWTTLAAQAVTRQYHSTAVLLPDGRVLSSGGGICGTCDQVGYLAKNAEIFSPPYLFKKDGSGELAPRPVITGAPASVGYGAAFQIDTPNAASIQKVGLLRLASQTHSVEMEQRYVPLAFTAGAGSLSATSPANVNIAVPGVYMLFIVDAAGVPSVARMITLDPSVPPPPPPPKQCEDGVDNDGDGKVDLADPGCAAPTDDDESDDPPPPPPPAQCEDGVDNDGDGKVDLADPGCASATDDNESDDPPPPPPNALPTVVLTSPADGARFTSPAKMKLTATASDSDGTIVRVEFFNGASRIGEDTTAPYSLNWNVGAAGIYTVTARATDNAGGTKTSAPAVVTVVKKR